METKDVHSEAALIEGGGEAARATTINIGDSIRLDGPDGIVIWGEVTELEPKPKTIWLWLHIPGTGSYERLHLRPHHDDMFPVRRLADHPYFTTTGRGSS